MTLASSTFLHFFHTHYVRQVWMILSLHPSFLESLHFSSIWFVQIQQYWLGQGHNKWDSELNAKLLMILFAVFQALIKVAGEKLLAWENYKVRKCKILVESLQLKWKLIILWILYPEYFCVKNHTSVKHFYNYICCLSSITKPGFQWLATLKVNPYRLTERLQNVIHFKQSSTQVPLHTGPPCSHQKDRK